MNIQRKLRDMRVRSKTKLSAAAKPRPMASNAGAVALIAVALIFMFLHQGDKAVAVRSKAALQDVFTPVISFLSTPAEALSSISSRAKDITATYAENMALKSDNAELLQWQGVAKQLEKENAELRSLLGLAKPQNTTYLSARIIGAQQDIKSDTLLLSHTHSEQLQKGYAVVTSAGLVGRVIEASDTTARILLLTDSQSRLPVKHEASNAPAILVGGNNGALRLKFVENLENFAVGDRIVSAHNGEHIPANLVVGEVSAIEDNIVSIMPYSNIDELHFVSIVVPPIYDTASSNSEQ